MKNFARQAADSRDISNNVALLFRKRMQLAQGRFTLVRKLEARPL